MRLLLWTIFCVFSVNASNYYLTIKTFPVNKTCPKKHELRHKNLEIWFSLPGIYSLTERENSVMETRVSETGEATATITRKPTEGVRSSGCMLLRLLPIVLLVIG